MIKDQYKAPASVKDPKPKPVTRPQGKDAKRTTRDMKPAKTGVGYKTR